MQCRDSNAETYIQQDTEQRCSTLRERSYSFLRLRESVIPSCLKLPWSICRKLKPLSEIGLGKRHVLVRSWRISITLTNPESANFSLGVIAVFAALAHPPPWTPMEINQLFCFLPGDSVAFNARRGVFV